MSQIDPTTLADLKAKSPVQLYLLKHQGDEIVCKGLSPDGYRRFKQMAQDSARRLDAAERIVFDCLVFPDAAALQVMLGKRPALVDTFAGELLELAGSAKAAEVVPL